MSDPFCGYNWRIATTEPALAYSSFYALGLPVPSLAPPMPGQIELARGDGSQAIHGYRSLELFWDRLGIHYLRLLEGLVQAAAGGVLYVTYYDRGVWVDGRGYPWVPLEREMIGPLHSLRGRYGEDNYRLYLNNIEIVNNPSLYTLD